MIINEVEKLDKARYSAMKWMAVGFALFYCSMIANHLINFLDIDKFYRMYVALPVLLVGVVLLLLSLVKFVIVAKRIDSDADIKKMLNDELYIANGLQCFRISFIAFVLSMSISIILTSIFDKIPAVLICYIILFIVLMTTLISWLVFNRRNDEKL